MSKRMESITSFYDAIAGQYDTLLTDHDAKARKVIAEVFNETVPRGVVLDFGGGTGLDLPWLEQYYATTLFVEPSPNMRAMARKKHGASSRIRFFDGGTDFTQWSKEALPFPEKTDGILANFAVLNCIEDVSVFFEKMALVCTKQSHLLTTVLDPRMGSILKKKSMPAALRLLMTGKLTIHHQHEGIFHSTFIHSIKKLRNASSPYFDLLSLTAIPSSEFVLLIFARK